MKLHTNKQNFAPLIVLEEKSADFILWGPWMSVTKFEVMDPTVSEIFQPQSKFQRVVKLSFNMHTPHLRQTLQQTERNSTRATSHFQACILGICIHSSPGFPLQISEHKFNQLLHQHRENTALIMCDWSSGFHVICVCANLSPVQPQFQVSVWTQEVSSSASDLWSPTPQAHTAQAFYTNAYMDILSVKNI